MPVDQPPAIIRVSPDSSGLNGTKPSYSLFQSQDFTNAFDSTSPMCLVVAGPNAVPLVKFCNDGKITVDESMKPDKAARLFLAELQKIYPAAVCKP